MGKVLIGIVEDEMIIADTIAATLNKLGYECTEPCNTYSSAIEMLDRDQPDLVLVDIQLAGQASGIELGHKIKNSYHIPIVFLTSNSDAQTVKDAKTAEPDAYLVKPFNKEDLFTAIEVALFKKNKEDQGPKVNLDASIHGKSIFLKEDRNLVKVLFDEIKYLMSDHVYIEVHLGSRRHIARMKLDEILKRLPSQFVQVHRRYIVNLEKVTSIAANHLMIGDNEIPISKSHKADLLEKINRI